jgi:hypothetical protein
LQASSQLYVAIADQGGQRGQRVPVDGRAFVDRRTHAAREGCAATTGTFEAPPGAGCCSRVEQATATAT